MGIAELLSSNEREIRKFRKVVEKINRFEPELEALTDEQLRAKTYEFKEWLMKATVQEDTEVEKAKEKLDESSAKGDSDEVRFFTNHLEQAEAARNQAANRALDQILPEAFAVVREASKRTTGLRHFDVQMIGGIVLHEGRIAEMKTGEGKTLVATLPLYLNALEGKGAHLVTVNDYLAKFHAQWMGPIYNFLGLSVGALQGSNPETGELEASYIYDPEYVNEEEPVYENLRRVNKKEAYVADITYGTNHVYGFDYLRDNMAFSKEELAQRDLHYAIVDEVDSILIDEARTPLIISGQTQQTSDLYYKLDRVVRRLMVERDYTVDEKAKTAMLTDEGIKRVEESLGVENLADDNDLMHHASAALKAHAVYKKDVDYVVKDGQIIIVDEFTGRLMFGRRYSDGQHQAIEAKEGIKPEAESQTLATITYQNYFRLYKKLAGMTGTAQTEEEEFRKIYGLDVVIIPTNMPMIRMDHPDVIYKTEEAKFRGITLEILRLHSRQQPVLVGTRSIDASERVSERLSPEKLQLLAATVIFKEKLDESKLDGDMRKKFNELFNTRFGELTLGKLLPISRELGISMDMLTDDNIQSLVSIMEIESQDEINRLKDCLSRGIQHNILNAKFHEQEAQIIEDAGRIGMVTIATNMAGRGVDILLGGKSDESGARNPGADDVIKIGGLFIIGSERHESRRIDNQLRGRAGRQGDPGASRFFISLEDELWRVFGDKSKSPWLASWSEDMAMDSKILSKMIERTQKKMEDHYYEMRKQVLKYDDVMNKQREVIYSQRRKILEGVDLRQTIIHYLYKTVSEQVDMHCAEEVHPDEWDLKTLYEMLDETFPLSVYVRPDDFEGNKHHELEELLFDAVDKTYADRERELTPELMRDIERHIALRAINNKWMEHLASMDYLREGIGLRGYAQQDPVIAYTKEAFDMFEQMLNNIQDEIVRLIYRVQLRQNNEPYRNPYRNVQMHSNQYLPGIAQEEGIKPQSQGGMPGQAAPVRVKAKVGRNDPCPCGSGKKYKKCCLE